MTRNQRVFLCLFPDAFSQAISRLRENSGDPELTDEEIINTYSPVFYQKSEYPMTWFISVAGELDDDDKLAWMPGEKEWVNF